jgi:hypothetical protein
MNSLPSTMGQNRFEYSCTLLTKYGILKVTLSLPSCIWLFYPNEAAAIVLMNGLDAIACSITLLSSRESHIILRGGDLHPNRSFLHNPYVSRTVQRLMYILGSEGPLETLRKPVCGSARTSRPKFSPAHITWPAARCGAPSALCQLKLGYDTRAVETSHLRIPRHAAHTGNMSPGRCPVAAHESRQGRVLEVGE